MLDRVKALLNLGKELQRLPTVDIDLKCDSAECTALYNSFTRPHSKLPVVKAKVWGVAILDLRKFETEEDYLKSVGGKNSAAYFARKAERAGYEFRTFNVNDELEEIYLVNTSASERQGHSMAEWYATKQESIKLAANYICRGVYIGDKLTGYAFIGIFGELAIISNILGHADHLKEGVMYKLVTGLCAELAVSDSVRFVMYDTILGASPGLRMFKERCGFEAHRVNWKK